jgi:hypothetical protein
VLTQGVALGGADEVLLAFLTHGAQGIGERRPNLPLLDPVPDARSKFRGQGKPAHDPGFAPAEQPCNTSQTEPVIVEQGLDDARFIHRRRRARRGVRTQHEELLLDRRVGRLDDRRHNRLPLVHPSSEPLEAVDDLKKAVSRLNHAHGKITELRPRLTPHLNAPQPFVTRAHQGNGNRSHECRRLVRRNCIACRRQDRCGPHGRAR